MDSSEASLHQRYLYTGYYFPSHVAQAFAQSVSGNPQYALALLTEAALGKSETPAPSRRMQAHHWGPHHDSSIHLLGLIPGSSQAPYLGSHFSGPQPPSRPSRFSNQDASNVFTIGVTISNAAPIPGSVALTSTTEATQLTHGCPPLGSAWLRPSHGASTRTTGTLTNETSMQVKDEDCGLSSLGSERLEQLAPGKTIARIITAEEQPESKSAIDILMNTIQAKPELPEAQGESNEPQVSRAVTPTKSQETKSQETKAQGFQCNHPGCTQSFFQYSHLTIHKRSHTGERPFFCTVPGCNARFSQRANLKTHERRHTGEKPFTCDECGKTFAQSSSVKPHKKTHLKTKPFSCKLGSCTKVFSQRGNLKMHHNNFHKADIEELNRKFADPASMSKEDCVLRDYLAAVYKNSNKGVKGRGKARRITQASHPAPSPALFEPSQPAQTAPFPAHLLMPGPVA